MPRHSAAAGAGEQGGKPPAEAGGAAFAYFLTAAAVSLAAALCFAPLARRQNRLAESRAARLMSASLTSVDEAERTARKAAVSLGKLLRDLFWPAAAVFLCFAVAMFFPVFSARVRSVSEGSGAPLLQPAAFIPLAFFAWSLGDLLGRVATALPAVATLRRRPRALFALAIARLAFLPLYLLCNVDGAGAAVESDLFYLVVVQLPFGLTTGLLAASCMMAAGEMVEEGEREAAGSFMGLCLVAGLTCGSLLSFTASSM